MQNVLDNLEGLYIDWASLDWKQFYSPHEFQWKYGTTPFSHFQVPILASIMYLISLFALKNFMKDRKPLSLKTITLVHNVFLTCISLVMFCGATYGAILKYREQGFWAGLVCEQDSQPIKGPLFYWTYIFYISKFYELIDTYLIVLKKKPIIFLHVWHHFVMPITCWAGLEGKWCLALWTSTFWNSFVHVLMYYYYTISTFGYNPWWKKHLTALQIFQFVNGFVYTLTFFYYYLDDFKITFSEPSILPIVTFTQGCTGDLRIVLLMFSVNCSFLVLFSQFFIENYIFRRNQLPRQPKTLDSSEKNSEIPNPKKRN